MCDIRWHLAQMCFKSVCDIVRLVESRHQKDAHWYNRILYQHGSWSCDADGTSVLWGPGESGNSDSNRCDTRASNEACSSRSIADRKASIGSPSRTSAASARL